ncbi:DUF305 domain-containing protein [Planomonospora sp. ID91781]|uniref:DUF305 domain-containing protein n=1 Tax=Planomonospora sp. ID91781 TaxID=2738135 RepID=UPI0018C3FAF1|nr:DUF305 domain-containing protein [Planomonospora sp. ID91781]
MRLTALRRNIAVATAVAAGAIVVPVTIAWSTSPGSSVAVTWNAPNVAAAPAASRVAAPDRPRAAVPTASRVAAPRGHHDHDSDLQPYPTPPRAYDFGETLAKLEGDLLEIAFFAQMIPHHRAGVEMSRLHLQRGVDPQLRTHSENIIAFQGFQIGQFTRWLRDWYGLTPRQAVQRLPREARREIEDLDEELAMMVAELREVPAGRRFDVEFARMMIPHHLWGIMEFLEPEARAVHPELRVASATGIVAQQAQVADLRTWLSGRPGGRDGRDGH